MDITRNSVSNDWTGSVVGVVKRDELDEVDLGPEKRCSLMTQRGCVIILSLSYRLESGDWSSTKYFDSVVHFCFFWGDPFRCLRILLLAFIFVLFCIDSHPHPFFFFSVVFMH